MYRFKKKKQELMALFLDGLNLFGQGLRHVWPWAILAALFGMFAPHLTIQSLEFDGAKFHIAFDWSVIAIMAIFSVPGLYFLAVLMRRMFLMGADQEESIQISLFYVAKRFIPIFIAELCVSLLTGIGMLFFLLPGIFVSVAFVFVGPLILLDDYNIWEAFKISWELVVGNWWRIFLMLIFPYLLFAISGYLPKSEKPLMDHLIHSMMMCFALPLLSAFILTIFYDTKLRHKVPLHLPRKLQKKTAKKKSTAKKTPVKRRVSAKKSKA